MTEEALNSLRALARLPIEDLADITDDDSVIYMVGDYKLTVGHVRDARDALALASSGASSSALSDDRSAIDANSVVR